MAAVRYFFRAGVSSIGDCGEEDNAKVVPRPVYPIAYPNRGSFPRLQAALNADLVLWVGMPLPRRKHELTVYCILRYNTTYV